MGKRKRQEPNQWDGKVLFIIQLVRNMEDEQVLRAALLEQLNATYRQGLTDAIAEAREAT